MQPGIPVRLVPSTADGGIGPTPGKALELGPDVLSVSTEDPAGVQTNAQTNVLVPVGPQNAKLFTDLPQTTVGEQIYAAGSKAATTARQLGSPQLRMPERFCEPSDLVCAGMNIAEDILGSPAILDEYLKFRSPSALICPTPGARNAFVVRRLARLGYRAGPVTDIEAMVAGTSWRRNTLGIIFGMESIDVGYVVDGDLLGSGSSAQAGFWVEAQAALLANTSVAEIERVRTTADLTRVRSLAVDALREFYERAISGIYAFIASLNFAAPGTIVSVLWTGPMVSVGSFLDIARAQFTAVADTFPLTFASQSTTVRSPIPIGLLKLATSEYQPAPFTPDQPVRDIFSDSLPLRAQTLADLREYERTQGFTRGARREMRRVRAE